MIIRGTSASSIWNHKYDFRPKLHDTKFNYHFIASILPAIWYVTLNKVWNLFGCAVLVFLFHWLGKSLFPFFALNRTVCDSEQKMVRFGNKSHCWEPIRLPGSPLISKWMTQIEKRPNIKLNVNVRLYIIMYKRTKTI